MSLLNLIDGKKLAENSGSNKIPDWLVLSLIGIVLVAVLYFINKNNSENE